MPVEMRMWRIDGERPRPLSTAVLPTEAALEDFLEQDPSLLGTPLLVIGRQVRTPHGKLIDLLAIDADGNLHALELKRDKTPRDVVAQVLDYGSWITDPHPQAGHRSCLGTLGGPVRGSLRGRVSALPRPTELNAELGLPIVATDLDASSGRIVAYLRGFGVFWTRNLRPVAAAGQTPRTAAAPWRGTSRLCRSGGMTTLEPGLASLLRTVNPTSRRSLRSTSTVCWSWVAARDPSMKCQRPESVDKGLGARPSSGRPPPTSTAGQSRTADQRRRFVGATTAPAR